MNKIFGKTSKGRVLFKLKLYQQFYNFSLLLSSFIYVLLDSIYAKCVPELVESHLKINIKF